MLYYSLIENQISTTFLSGKASSEEKEASCFFALKKEKTGVYLFPDRALAYRYWACACRHWGLRFFPHPSLSADSTDYLWCGQRSDFHARLRWTYLSTKNYLYHADGGNGSAHIGTRLEPSRIPGWAASPRD